jgi:hypothetical protein
MNVDTLGENKTNIHTDTGTDIPTDTNNNIEADTATNTETTISNAATIILLLLLLLLLRFLTIPVLQVALLHCSAAVNILIRPLPHSHG